MVVRTTARIAATAACAFVFSAFAAADITAGDTPARAEKAAAALAADMARLCPVAGAADQAAFESCRKALYADSLFKRSLTDIVPWGRQRDPALTLKESSLTQFAPDVLSGMYVPLFMFNGKYTVAPVQREGLYQIRLQTAFRNRLQPGQFPYPFWHEAEKWSMYERANEIILWWDPKSERVRFAQFTVFGPNPALQANEHVTQPAFDGKWMWTDAQGRTQPTVTVFDGLLRPDNPYIGQVQVAYKELALRLREGQCFDCHVPNNPDKAKRLVLLQTPMHAAAEIKRLMKSVREDRMPRDEFGIEQPLDTKMKETLLKEGAAFEQVLELARQWEATGPATAMHTDATAQAK
jgi:hypothetical protein